MHTSAQTATVIVTPQQALWLELMQFYIREAWLLDERKFTEWLDLFTEDVLYFMPRRKNVPRRELHREVTPLGDLALFEDDKRYLQMRVARLPSEGRLAIRYRSPPVPMCDPPMTNLLIRSG